MCLVHNNNVTTTTFGLTNSTIKGRVQRLNSRTAKKLFQTVLLAAISCCGLTGTHLAQAQGVPPAVSRPIQPFDYKGVTLGEGPLKRQFDEVRYDYLRIPEDALLKGFRQRAGLPAPGADLGGWYSSDTFHVFGQILSGLARMYAATGDPTCKARADYLLHEWTRCIAPDGYFYFSKTPNAPHYIYEKMVGGLVDMVVYCHSPEARSSLARITDWAETHLSRKRGYAFNSEAGDTEWYTLSENLYRAYLATGEKRYRDFAKVWEYTEYWDIYARKGDIFGKRPNGQQTGGYHAYSHVNTLSGLGAAYLVTGDRHYLQTLENSYDSLQLNQCFATGGYGPNELLAPRDTLTRLLGETHNTFETQCGSWAGFKVSKYLISCTGDARFGDWIERLILNGIGASISMTPDGHVFYYSDYNTSGAVKKNIGESWTCCTGTRPMAVADYHDLIFFHNADTLFVNLFTPAEVNWPRSTGEVHVSQQTRFPEASSTTLLVDPARPGKFTIAIRSPQWLSGPMTATVAGQAVVLKAGSDHWLRITRNWKRGDRLTLQLPMALHTERFDPAQAYPAAVMIGPVALAFDTSAGRPSRGDLKGALDATVNLKPVPGKQLEFALAGASHTIAKPFYRYGPGENYLLYLDPSAPQRIGYQTMKFSAGWHDSGGFRFMNQVGSTAEATFDIPTDTGGIRWLGYRYDDAGVAQVAIDGVVVATVDQFGPGRDLPFDWHITGLKKGRHTIKWTLLPARSAQSKDCFINIAGLELLEP